MDSRHTIPPCPCGPADDPPQHDPPDEAAQALVEFAIVTAIALPLMLAAAQVALLLAYLLAQQQATATLAALYDRTGATFDAVVTSEAGRIGCGAPEAVVTTPRPELVVVTFRCTWHAPVYRDASWPVTTSASAARPTPSPTPTPEPSPEEPSE